IAGQTLLSFPAGYIVPKIKDFDAKKLMGKSFMTPNENIFPGLEPCFLALGTFENTLRRLAVILEKHCLESQSTCPGTDKDLVRILRHVEKKPYFEYHRTTIDQKV
ncbi:MAG: hypothetical protein GY861_06140, partial [bacterium]|nr:hypothetical protein [bacterium]